MHSVFLINIFSSFFLCGVIWTIQIVHYPFFHRVSREQFSSHMSTHKVQISLIVIPVMLLELGSSIWLSIFAEFYPLAHQAGLLLVVLIWLHTFLVMVPLHENLSAGYSKLMANRLVKSNWGRTPLWSIKTLLGIWLLNEIL